MRQTRSEEIYFDSDTSREVTKIDYRRIYYRAIKYWYFVVLSVLVSICVAFLRNRYATRVFPVTTSILIKEDREMSEARLLYNNPLVSGYRNYYNELYIIRSYPLVEAVLERNNLNVSFLREGNVLTSEAYDYIPVSAHFIEDGGNESQTFYFTIENANSYLLTSNQNSAPQTYSFNDTIQQGGSKIVFKRNHSRDFEPYVGTQFIVRYTASRRLAGNFVGRLSASWAEQGAGVVNLSITGPNPFKEKDFLNGLIREYQQMDLDKKNDAATRTIEFISSQLGTISDSLRKSERQLELFKNKNVVTNLDDEALRLYKRLEELEFQRAELAMRANYLDYLVEYIGREEQFDQVILPSSVGLNDAVLSFLVNRMVELQMQAKSLVGRGKEENPYVESLQTSVSEIKNDIMEAIRNQQGIDEIKDNFLSKEIGILEKQIAYLPMAEKELISIQRNYSVLENLYVFLLQKRAEADISKASTTSDIMVVNPPMVGGPITPKPNQNYIVAFVLGLGLPIVIFVLLELLNTKIQSKEDIEKITEIPFIGGVGHKLIQSNLEVLERPKTSIAESFRSLRSNLQYFLKDKTNATILIGSSISGEGKSFTSINLASVLVLSGKTTLIVGADLRRPKLFADFGLTNETGLSNYLAGLSSFDSIIQNTPYPGLDLVSGGPVPPNPSELLLTKRMDDFFSAAIERYNYVIVDSPPLAIVADAFALAKYADHTIFLVRQNFTPKGILKVVEDFYQSGKLSNISIVLNDIYKYGPGYGYGYSYGYYRNSGDASYYNDEKLSNRTVLGRLFERSKK